MVSVRAVMCRLKNTELGNGRGTRTKQVVIKKRGRLLLYLKDLWTTHAAHARHEADAPHEARATHAPMQPMRMKPMHESHLCDDFPRCDDAPLCEGRA